MTLTPEPPAWAVFLVWMEATRPAAKYKFFIVLSVQGGSALGVLINSRINTLGQTSRRAPCFAPVTAAEHSFLHHDSWADCTGTFTVPLSQLTQHQGQITPSTAGGIQAALRVCPILKPKTKALLLGVPLPE